MGREKKKNQGQRGNLSAVKSQIGHCSPQDKRLPAMPCHVYTHINDSTHLWIIDSYGTAPVQALGTVYILFGHLITPQALPLLTRASPRRKLPPSCHVSGLQLMVFKAPSQPSSANEHNPPLQAKQPSVLLSTGALTVELASKIMYESQDRELYPVLYKMSARQGGEEE